MKIKSKYIADDNIEFNEGVEVEIASAIDDYKTKLVNVEVALMGEDVNARRFIGSFAYNDTWTDEDVWNFIKTKIELI